MMYRLTIRIDVPGLAEDDESEPETDDLSLTLFGIRASVVEIESVEREPRTVG